MYLIGNNDFVCFFGWFWGHMILGTHTPITKTHWKVYEKSLTIESKEWTCI